MRPDSLLPHRAASLMRRCALILIGSLLGAGSALAAPAWKDLNSSQQALIRPALLSQGGDFDKLAEPRRAALVKGADRWLAMTPAQRTVATAQFQQWQQLTVAEKLAVLDRRDRFRKLSPDERKALLKTHKQFLETSLERQQELREQYNQLAPALDSLPAQPFGTPATPSPGTTAPVGLPTTTLPSSSVVVPGAMPR